MSSNRAKPVISLTLLLVFLALLYAGFAGLRTVGDPDLGWQLATGGWIVRHHQVPAAEVLAYTATGGWIYPVLSQVLLYLAYAAGGFSLLSWCGAAGCVFTVLFLARHNATSTALAIVAVPIIASRTSPRAEMFTELCFAVVVTLLWSYHRGRNVPLWVLPLVMLGWTNLHLGFIAGLAMCVAYVVIEIGDVDTKLRWNRLRAAAPYLAATLVATAANPWGVNIYSAIARQGRIMSIHAAWIPEWRAVRITPSRLAGAFAVRNPDSAFWWLLAVALAAVIMAAARRRYGTAIVLLVGSLAALNYARFKGPFAALVVIIGGTVLHEALTGPVMQRFFRSLQTRIPLRAFVGGAVCLAAGFVGLRSFDLVTNRFYFRTTNQMSVFGAGESPWFPEEATRFMGSHRLKANLFNDYAAGGFLAAKLEPYGYRVYIDGRSIPFSDEHFFQSFKLLQLSPDGPEWAAEIERRKINTIIVSLDRNLWDGLDNLPGFCHSTEWAPVYMDANAAVFVRRQGQEVSGERLNVDCDTAPFPVDYPAHLPQTNGHRFYYHLNSAAVLLSLRRIEEAREHLERAERLGIEAAYLHHAKGMLAGFTGDAEAAEREWRMAIQIAPSPESALLLAKLLENEGRLAEAEQLLRDQIALADEPSGLRLALGQIELAASRPGAALASFERAEFETPFRGAARSLGTGFFVQLHVARSKAWQELGNQALAVDSMRRAVGLAPDDAALSQQFAELSGEKLSLPRPAPVKTNGGEAK